MRDVLRQWNKRQAASGKWRVTNICLLSSVLFVLISVHTSCSPQQKQPEVPQDKPLAAFQTNLLQMAFDLATAIPVVPHSKDRSRAQESVAKACFDLDQPKRALEYIEKIDDWRRGAGYADYAFYAAQHGFTNEVPRHLNLAEQISLSVDQDWRRDRIKVRIAQTHLVTGQSGLSEQFSADIQNSESGKVEQVEARLCPDENFDSMMSGLQTMVDSGDFDTVKNTLYALTELFNRFYAQPERRAQTEQAIQQAWTAMPLFIRIELLEKMAAIALEHGDSSGALEWITRSQVIMQDAAWPLEYDVPATARRAALRFRAGESQAALLELREALERFNKRQNEVVDIYRTETLLPVAEAFNAAGDDVMALSVYRQALESAVVNPNSRPQAEDLSAICISMARNQLEPDQAFWARIRELQANLGSPW